MREWLRLAAIEYREIVDAQFRDVPPFRIGDYRAYFDPINGNPEGGLRKRALPANRVLCHQVERDRARG